MIYLIAYIAAMFLIALPVALFGRSKVAAAVFLVWGIGQVAYQLGAPEPETQAVIYGLGCAYTWAGIARAPHRWRFPEMLAALLFAPLLALTLKYTQGDLGAYGWWWSIYWVAIVQAAFLTRPIYWTRKLVSWTRGFRGKHSDGLFRTAS